MRELKIEVPSEAVAVIGMAGRFPGAQNVDEFWKNLEAGRETIAHFTDEELLRSGISPSLIEDPHYVRAFGRLKGIDLFDAAFFGVTPAEAAITAPDHRLLLECAWEALESAGYALPGLRIGVFAGVGFNAYLLRNVLSQTEPLRGTRLMQVLIGNEKDQAATRIAYKLDLRGPCITVQTACSTSLVAVHLACQSLINGECDLALAGGATISVPQNSGYLYQEGGILSLDGHCRAFDADARGTVPGNGVGIVLLKRAEDALRDRDVIDALIRGTAVNNDGANKIGYTAPSPKGQAAVIAEALAAADVDPDSIGYIETHGTGTALGDPIEIKALAEAYQSLKTNWRCAIGSVKSNIGHLDAAAGVTGMIKAVLALKRCAIPASLHFRKANPEINFAETPFFVNTEFLPWPVGEKPRRAAVSSFGIGGTNAHVILEEAPEPESAISSRPYHLLVFSAKCPESLSDLTESFNLFLKQHSSRRLADIAYTLQMGRKAFPHRRTLVCSENGAPRTLPSLTLQASPAIAERGASTVAFLFPGQGAQYVDMGREIYQTEPSFRSLIDYCANFLRGRLDIDLRSVLYPDPALRKEAASQLDQTHITQVALFVVEYALARLWMEWGVQPSAMIGHSIGEYAAACIAGVFSLDDALFLVAARGRLMHSLPRGAMIAVSLSAERLEEAIGSSISIASDNSADSCVLSGPVEEIAKLEQEFDLRGIRFRRLRTSHAFHSAMVDPILNAFKVEVAKARPSPPRIPYVSNLTGDWIKPEQAVSPDYWVKHLRQTVRFREGQQCLLQTTNTVLLEVGPGHSLSTFVRRTAPQSPSIKIAASMRHPQENVSDAEHLMDTLGFLWRSGVEIDWRGYWKHEMRNRVRLPTYPFRRQRHWIEPLGDQTPGDESIPDANARLEDTFERQLQTMIDQLQAMAGDLPDRDVGINHKEIPLNPIQAWFFEQDLAEPNHFNHSVQLELRERLDVELIRRAFLAVVEAHEALRTHYRKNSAGWGAFVKDPDYIVREGIGHIRLPARGAEAAFNRAKAEANRSLNLQTGPLMRLLIFDRGDSLPQQMLFVCHHLLVDLFSWATILSDIEIACAQLSHGQRVLLPDGPCVYSHWTARLRQYAQSREARRELLYWVSPDRGRAAGVPLDYTGGSNTEGDASVVDVRLSLAETDALLAIAPRVYESSLCDIVLAAMSAALNRWAGGPVLVDIEGHGREDLFPDLELGRVVGWLTAIYPFLLDVPHTVEPERAVRLIRDKRREVPHGGIGYGLLRYLSGDAEIVDQLSAARQAAICFNYEEQSRPGAGLLFAQKSLSSSVSPLNRRPHLLDVQVGVREKQFYLFSRYSTRCHQRKTIEDIAIEILDSLRRFVGHASKKNPATVALFSNCSGN